MAKKSQIGVFILLGVILLIGFSFMIYLRGGKAKEAEIEKISRLPVQKNEKIRLKNRNL